MPNWCHNRVEIYGDENLINEVHSKYFTKDVLDFNKVIPMPEELRITSPAQTDEEKKQAKINLKKHGAKDWYDWACENWGTKWNPRTCYDFEKDPDFLRFEFETAWAPPEKICDKLRELFPDLSIRWFYDEPGCEIAGYL